MKKTMITPMLAALGILAAPIAFAQPGPGERPQRPGRGERPPPRQVEPEQRREALLDRYDANQNGRLDEAEYIAIGKDVEAGRFGPRGPRGDRPNLGGPGPRGDRPNLGGPGPRGNRPNLGPGPRGERGPRAGAPGPRQQELLDRYDANDNNRLDPEERAQMRQDVEDGKLEAPPRLQARRGFGPPPGRGPGRPGRNAPPGE